MHPMHVYTCASPRVHGMYLVRHASTSALRPAESPTRGTSCTYLRTHASRELIKTQSRSSRREHPRHELHARAVEVVHQYNQAITEVIKQQSM